MTIVNDLTSSERGIVFYSTFKPIIKNGAQVGNDYHRVSLVPGSDLTGQPQEVVDFCNITWTEKVIADYISAS
jgi:hypothetical protein